MLNFKPNPLITLFIVDDNEVFRMMLKEQFTSKKEYLVHTFATGEDCLEHLNLKPDIILLDYHLDSEIEEAKNGLVIANEIKKRLKKANVFILSGDEKLRLTKTILNRNNFISKKKENLIKIIKYQLEDKYYDNLEKRALKYLIKIVIGGLFILASILYLMK